jgi:hypothetical protein
VTGKSAVSSSWFFASIFDVEVTKNLDWVVNEPSKCDRSTSRLATKCRMSPARWHTPYQRDPEAVEKWQREIYPSIARGAKREMANIFFWDESGSRADAMHGKTWGVCGQTPVVERPGNDNQLASRRRSMPKAPSGYEGALSAELFVDLLKKMMHHRKRPAHLVIDGLPAHKKGCTAVSAPLLPKGLVSKLPSLQSGRPPAEPAFGNSSSRATPLFFNPLPTAS